MSDDDLTPEEQQTFERVKRIRDTVNPDIDDDTLWEVLTNGETEDSIRNWMEHDKRLLDKEKNDEAYDRAMKRVAPPG